MADSKIVVNSFLKFLEEEISCGTLSDENIESIQVAQQCLQAAYDIGDDELHRLPSADLRALFASLPPDALTKESDACVTDESKREADELKQQGNDYLRGDKADEAIRCYNRAIELDSTNPVYFSNRAAAYYKLAKYRECIEDCQRAVQRNSNYSKAYNRIGLAHVALGEHKEALTAFKKALEIEPGNENYRRSVAETESLIQGTQPNQRVDLSGLLNNPMMMNFATQMMSNPQVQQMMSNPQMQQMVQQIISGGSSATTGPGTGSGQQTMPDMSNLGQMMSNPHLMQQMMSQMNAASQPPTSATTAGADGSSQSQPDITPLLQAGQQLAQEMQANNPDLVNSLRQQFTGMNAPASGNSPSNSNEQQPPNDATQ